MSARQAKTSAPRDVTSADRVVWLSAIAVGVLIAATLSWSGFRQASAL